MAEEAELDRRAAVAAHPLRVARNAMIRPRRSAYVAR
jgi:hypothetical protein